MDSFPLEKMSSKLLLGLMPRSRDILEKRFGLASHASLTLEEIGKKHGLTRERVRQIVEDSMDSLKNQVWREKKEPALFELYAKVSRTLSTQGSLKREDLLFQVLGSEGERTHAVFLLSLSQNLTRQKETDEIHTFWSNNKEFVNMVPHFLQDLISLFQEKQSALSLQELEEELDDFSPPTLRSFLEVSKYLVMAHNGKWGLASWPQVNPKTVRDKAYLVLQETGSPLHFRTLALAMKEFQDKFPTGNGKPVLAQTVHNELIKDERFVLVGRGTYALADWGYTPGTVKDVIQAMLAQEKTPLSKTAIIQKTLEQRQVKESTVALNLQDKSVFQRDKEGNYYLVRG